MSAAAEKAIAVFDSGVGGLTVFKALRRAMPSEKLIYFGDTARLPYGTKSPEVVQRFSVEIARYLARKKIKLFVIACNSASALAFKALRKTLRVPVLDVIGPAVRTAAAVRGRGAVGVIGTAATVQSGAYQRALKKALGGRRILAKACPLLVPLVEEGWFRHPITRQVLREYLKSFGRVRLEALILGCTHYPLLKPLLRAELRTGTRLIDSGEEVARDADELLRARKLRRLRGRGTESFYVTDGAERFRRLAQRILGGRRRRVHVVRFPF